MTDVDGHDYADFCLGDTGAMAGPRAGRRGGDARSRARHHDDAADRGRRLGRRGAGAPLRRCRCWQFSLTATDANRWMLRICRQVTGRPKVLVFNCCYHGSVDEAFVDARRRRAARAARGQRRPAGRPGDDHARGRVQRRRLALEAALAHGDVACVLAEPALTNIGIVLPEPGFHEARARA